MIKLLKVLVDKIGVLLSIIGTLLLIFIMMYTVISVFLRFFTGVPLLGTVELGSILLPALSAMFYIYTDIVEKHVRATIIYERLSIKMQRILDIVYDLIGGGIFAIVGWRGAIYASKCAQMGSETSVLALPTPPFQYSFSITCFCFAFYLFIKSLYLFSIINRESHATVGHA